MAFELKLSHLETTARGSERAIYFHPDYPDVIFKIVVGKDIDLRSGKFEHFALGLFPKRLLMRRSRKELLSYQISKLDYHVPDATYPAAEMRGYYESDLGLAIAFERITDGANAVGPTLAQIASNGEFLTEHVDLLNAFAKGLLTWNLIASDLNLSNIVLGQRGKVSQFILVDGMGAPHLIPLRYWSRRFNRHELFASLRKIERNVNNLQNNTRLHFNEEIEAFEIVAKDGRAVD